MTTMMGRIPGSRRERTLPSELLPVTLRRIVGITWIAEATDSNGPVFGVGRRQCSAMVDLVDKIRERGAK